MQLCDRAFKDRGRATNLFQYLTTLRGHILQQKTYSNAVNTLHGHISQKEFDNRYVRFLGLVVALSSPDFQFYKLCASFFKVQSAQDNHDPEHI